MPRKRSKLDELISGSNGNKFQGGGTNLPTDLHNTNFPGWIDSIHNALGNINKDYIIRLHMNNPPVIPTQSLPGADNEGKPWSSYPIDQYSSHLMGTNGAGTSFPHIFRKPDGSLTYISSDDDAEAYGRAHNDFIDFNAPGRTQAQATQLSEDYSGDTAHPKGGYKEGKPLSKPKYQKGGAATPDFLKFHNIATTNPAAPQGSSDNTFVVKPPDLLKKFHGPVPVPTNQTDQIKRQEAYIRDSTTTTNNYVIIDKKNNTISYYDKNHNHLGTEPVITGATNKDVDYSISMKDYFEKTGTKDHQKYFDYLKAQDTKTTPSGHFTVAEDRHNVTENPDMFGRAINAFRPDVADTITKHRLESYGPRGELFTLKSDAGVYSSKAIHGTAMPDRMDAFNNPTADRNMSNGCINVNGQSICFDQLHKGTGVFVLPEETDDIVRPADGGTNSEANTIHKFKSNVYNTLKTAGKDTSPDAINFITSVAGAESKYGTSAKSKVEDYLPGFKTKGDFQINPNSFKKYLPQDYDISDDKQIQAVSNFYEANKKLGPEGMYNLYNAGTHMDSPNLDKFSKMNKQVTTNYGKGGKIGSNTTNMKRLTRNKFQSGGTATPDFLKFHNIATTNPADATQVVNSTVAHDAQVIPIQQRSIARMNQKHLQDASTIGQTDPNTPLQNERRLNMNQDYANAKGDRVDPITGDVVPSAMSKLAANPTFTRFADNIVLPTAEAYAGGAEELTTLGAKMLIENIGKGSLKNQARVLINNGAVKGFSEAPLMDAANVNYKNSESARFNSYTDNEIVGNKDLLWKGGMDPEKADFRPYNKQTEKTMQQEYIDNMKNYYESPEFNRIMDEEYPEVDKEMYKQKTLDNLQNPLTFSQDKVSANASGTYYSKNSSDALYTPNHKPSFKQRIANANTRDPSMSYDFSDKKGKSFVKHFRAVDHELGHQRTNSNELIPSFLTRDFLQDNFNANAKADLKAENAFGLKKEFEGDYHANPTEFEVRMRQLKTDLKNKGIADYFQRPIKPDDIYNLIDAKVGISKDTNDLLSFYSPEFLAKMAKVVPVLGATVAGGAAALKTGSGTDKYAKGGIVRRKFQKGGRAPIPGTPAQAKAYSDSLNAYHAGEDMYQFGKSIYDDVRGPGNTAFRKGYDIVRDKKIDLSTPYGDTNILPVSGYSESFIPKERSWMEKTFGSDPQNYYIGRTGQHWDPVGTGWVRFKEPVQPITITPVDTRVPQSYSKKPKPIPPPTKVQGNSTAATPVPQAGNLLPAQPIEYPNQPTNWSFTSRDENEPSKQSTQFFKSYDDYKKYTDDPNLRFISKDETADKSFAQGAGYSKFQSGGLTSEHMRNWNGVVNYAKTQNLDPNVLNHDPTIGFGIIDQYNKANPGAQFPRDSVNAIQSMMQQYRTDAITRMKASPIPENNFGPNYENFMPGLSAPDNFPGSKTLGWNIPEAYMQNTNAGITTKTDVGLAPKVKFSKGGNTKTTNMKRMTRKKIIPYYVGGGGTPTATVDNGGDTGKDLSAEDIASYLNSGESIVTDAAGLLGNKSMYKGANTGKLIGNTLGTGLGALVGGPLGAKIGGTVLGAVGNIIGSGNDARKMGQVEEDRLRRQYGTMNINTNLNPYGTTFQEGGVINKTGYTPGTESYNNPMNIIPGGDITMKNTPFPVMAHPSNGNPVMMQPGSNYKFDGAKYVAELPMRRDPRFNMQTEDGSTNASYKMGNGKAITAGYDGGFNAGLRFNFEAGGSVNNDNQQPPQMPPQDPQQPQQQTQINIERGELMVNPQDMSVIKDFSNKNRYSAHKSKQFMEPMGNFVNVPQGAVIIPKKLAMRYKNGDMLSKKSILLQILSDQASDPMHNVPEEQQPQEQQQQPQQGDSQEGQDVGQDVGQGYQGEPQAKKGGRFMGINPAHKGFETGQEYDLDESEISSLIAQGYQIQRL